ncbi:hypothetical protein F5X99DRAFT_407578 [Biscogniauxia marginata]|nr:hypothetical protein F5X99DRAFT_407578 [Biscogniauxia marginata]
MSSLQIGASFGGQRAPGPEAQASTHHARATLLFTGISQTAGTFFRAPVDQRTAESKSTSLDLWAMGCLHRPSTFVIHHLRGSGGTHASMQLSLRSAPLLKQSAWNLVLSLLTENDMGPRWTSVP